uniref:Uncharacterized protein n=1 Tax=Engystomops pustulosus TaxID=76066 RepID=A0AAV6YMJ0_ENGPU|nr:hypothetical protein GDO81_024747 [Engystomops pustulosus]
MDLLPPDGRKGNLWGCQKSSEINDLYSMFLLRTYEETRAEEDIQQISVEVEHRPSETVILPEEEKHGEASGCSCPVEETGSQRSEEDEEVPVTDIYFVSSYYFCFS